MFISRELKQRSIAEYLIYMWQVEDMIRANQFDLNRINKNIVQQYSSLNQQQKDELLLWYESLITMMNNEGVKENGHLQINRIIIIMLTDLHQQLLHSKKFPYYEAAYYKALPFIVELRAKGAHDDTPELETCFNALYGVLLLKLQKKNVSKQTADAIKAISSLLAILSEYYIKDKQGELDID